MADYEDLKVQPVRPGWTPPREYKDNLIEVDPYAYQWTDGDWDEWPYPDKFTKTEATGGLADAIRKRLDLEPTEPVYLVERRVSTGYSEYTQEMDTYLRIEDRGGNELHEIECRWSGSVVQKLLDWLDEVPA